MSKTSFLRACACLIFAAVLVTGCGGGSGGGSGSMPGKSSFTAGPITSTGAGTVTVKGTSFNVSRASISGDGGTHGAADLKLGMQTEIKAGEITTDAAGSHSQASDVLVTSAIIGPVDEIDTSTRLLIVLGQTIDVLDTTVFDTRFPNGAFSIAVGDVLQIFATLDTTTGHYVATRIEPAVDAPLFQLRGVVADLDKQARTFTIGGQNISCINLSDNEIPANLANGMEVIVKLQKTPVDGAWIAVEVKTPAPQLAEHNEIEVKGRVTSITSPTQFEVASIPVDASGAKIEGTISLGADVKVNGSMVNGILIATKVETDHDDEHDNHEKDKHEKDKHGDDDEHGDRND